MSPRLPAAAILLSLLFAGCVGAPPEEPDERPAPDPGDSGDHPAGKPSYALVVIGGNYTAESSGGDGAGVCGYPSPPELDRNNGTLRFLSTPENLQDGTDFPFDSSRLTALVLLMMWDSSACGVAVTRAWPVYDPLPAAADIWLRGPDGSSRMTIESDGSAQLRDPDVIVPSDGAVVVHEQRGTTQDGLAWNATYAFAAFGYFPAAGLAYPSL